MTSGKLENVMIFDLENETNVTTTIRAPSGEIEMDATNKQIHREFVRRADGDPAKTTGNLRSTSAGKLPIRLRFEHVNEPDLQAKNQRHDFRAVADELRDLEQKLKPAARRRDQLGRIARATGARPEDSGTI